MNLAGLFRGWRRHSDDESSADVDEAVGISTPAPVPSIARTAAAPMAQPRVSPVPPPPAQLSNEVDIPLQPILEKLPQDLRVKMTMRMEDLAGASISISTAQILPQLALGSVKITFGQLRGAAPELFRVAEQYDLLPIILPLNILLARLNPNLLPRNPNQKSLDAPAEIKGPFGPKAEGVTFATSLLKAPPSSTPPTRMTAPPEPSKIHARMVAPPPPAFTRPASPVIPPQPRQEMPAPPVEKTIPFAAPPSVAPPKPIVPIAPTVAQIPITPVVPAAPIAPATEAAAFFAPLAALSEKWPEPVRFEIQQWNLTSAQVALPMNLVEPALKRGRVIFPWQHLRAWMSPRPAGASPNDAVELELPIKIIAPLFLERYRPRPQARLSADQAIPNLFFGFPSPEMEAPAAPPVAPAPIPKLQMSEPQPLRATIPPPAPAAPVAPPAQPIQPSKMADTNFFAPDETLKAPAMDQIVYARAHVETDFKKRLASPKEIVERAMMVPGVVGAVIALPDGLKVAAQVPPDLNADTVAAFLPQIFDRVGQSTRELRMGALNNLKFTVGNVPWKVFRVNAVYFAAFGRAGERLPTAELAQLAAELDRKTK